MPAQRAIAIVGDDIEDRDGTALDPRRLPPIARLLDAAYPDARMAGFSTSPSRLVGILVPDADPLIAVLLVGLLDGHPRVRWSIVEGELATGRSRAPGRAAALLRQAAEGVVAARARRDRLVIWTGVPGADHLLEALGPLLAELLDELTDRQRSVARMLLVDGLRQADVADVLAVSRATISVMVARGRIRSIDRLAGAVRSVLLAARQARAEGGDGVPRSSGS